MQYRARQQMTFMVNGKTKEQTQIEPGTLLDAIQLSELHPLERANFEKMQKREQKRDPRIRLLFFRWKNVVRAAQAGRDLEVVTQRRPMKGRARRDRTRWKDK